jgi:hypothetical protein
MSLYYMYMCVQSPAVYIMTPRTVLLDYVDLRLCDNVPYKYIRLRSAS